MQTPNLYEESYLRRILISVTVRDFSAPFRTDLDNWFAFTEGGPFLNSNSRPHWFNAPCPDKHGAALNRAHFVSAVASRTLAGFAEDRLMKDHAIPVSVLRDMLFDAQPKSVEDLRAFLIQHYCFGIITYEEDRILNAAGLRSGMPDGWVTSDGPFARYERAGIVAQNQGRSDQSLRMDALPSAPPKKGLNPRFRFLSSTSSRRDAEGGNRG